MRTLDVRQYLERLPSRLTARPTLAASDPKAPKRLAQNFVGVGATVAGLASLANELAPRYSGVERSTHGILEPVGVALDFTKTAEELGPDDGPLLFRRR